MKTLGAAVIGLGFGRAHLKAYAAHAGVAVRGVCDDDPERLAQAREEYHIPFATADYRESCGAVTLTLVTIATPDHLHAEMCLAALRAGKHVLCEKPMTTTLEDALAVAAAARESGRNFDGRADLPLHARFCRRQADRGFG